MTFKLFPKAWLILAALVLLIPSQTPAIFPDLVPHDVQSLGVIETVSHDGNRARLRFQLGSLERYNIPNRASYHFWLLSAPGNTPRINMVSAVWWAIEEDGTRHGPFDMEEESEWGPLPDIPRRVRPSHVGSFRGFGMNRADFNPIHNSTRMVGSTRVPFVTLIEEAEFDLDIGGSARPRLPEVPLVQFDPYGMQIVTMLAANAPQYAQTYQMPEPIEEVESLTGWSEMLGEAVSRDLAWFSRLPRPGVYRIDLETLRRLGIDPLEFPVEDLRFFVGGREIPVLVENLRNGLMAGNSRIVFYAHKDADARKPYIPFWILGADGTSPPLRASIEAPTSRVLESAPAPGKTRIEIFEPNVYHHTLPLHGPNLKWASGLVQPRGFHEMEFQLAEIPGDATSQLTVWLSNMNARATTEFELYVNGNRVHVGSTRGIRVQEERVELPNRLLRSGTNTVALANREMPEGTELSPMFFLSARLDLATNSLGLLPHQILSVERASNTALGMQLPLFGSSDGSGVLLDISDPYRPVYTRMTTSRIGGTQIHTSITASIHRNPRFVHSQGNTMYRLPELEPARAPRSLLDDDPVDYLVIYHDSLHDSIQPLLDFRRRDRAVSAYRISDIYAAFSHGDLAYESIHKMIRHAFAHRQGIRLQEVLLVGEGSEYWWELTHARDDVTENMIPIFGWADPRIRIRGDDGYSLAVGDGPLSDVEIGRISVNTPEELDVIVKKLINYETSPPIGPWLSRNVFVTDEQPEFDRVVGEIVDKSFTGPNIPIYLSLNQFPYEDYFRGFWRKRSSVMTDRLIDTWNRGARTITYMGHGGPNLWSSNRIMHLRDVDHIDTQGRFPFLIAGSCDTGWVDYPVEPVKSSLAEEFLRSERGGVIAAYIPIDGTSSYEHNFLLTALFDAKFRHEIRDVGTLTLLSKVNYFLQRNNPSVTNQYLLMGDPATKLAPDPEPLAVRAEPRILLTRTDGSLTVSATPGEMEWGLAKVELLDPRSRPVSSARARVTDGAFTVDLEIPRQMERGVYRVVALAHNEANGEIHSGMVNIPVVDASMRLSWETSVPDERLFPSGTQVDLTLRIENVSEIDVNGAILQVRAVEGNTEISRGLISIAAGETFVRGFQPRLPPGLYTLEARLFASLADLEEERDPLAEGFVRLRGATSEMPLLALSEADVKVDRVTTEGNSKVNMRLYNMTSRRIDDHRALLRRVVGTEAGGLGQVATLPTIPPEVGVDFSFTTEHPLEPGEITFALDVLSPVRQDNLEDAEESIVYTRVQRLVFDHELGVGPDLEIVEGSFALEDENPLAGLTSHARFVVRNAGDVPMERVRGRLYIDEPHIAENEAKNSVPWATRNEIPRLDPGETHEFRLRWDPDNSTPNDLTLFAVVESQGNLVDINPLNNIAQREVRLRRPPNLAIDHGGIEFSHTLIRPHERVMVSVPYANTSDLDFLREFRITAHASSLAGGRTRILNHRIDSLYAGESGSLQFEWRVEPGQSMLEVDINEDREYLESTYEDNVSRRQFLHLLDADWFVHPGEEWNFDNFQELGLHEGLMLDPRGGITPTMRPVTSTIEKNFNQEYLVDGKVGKSRDVDNRWGLEGGGLYLSYDESADPVTFRFPLHEGGYHTNLYDLHVVHIGNHLSEQKSGHFNFRVGDEKDFTLHTPSRFGKEYLGRYRLRGNHLEITFAAPPFPSYNHLFAVTLHPVEGLYTSAVVKAPSMPRGILEAEVEEPGRSSVVFKVRQGWGVQEEVEWGPWFRVDRGQPIPEYLGTARFLPGPPRFFQWRACLVMSEEDRPTLHSVRIGVPPETPPGQLAATRR